MLEPGIGVFAYKRPDHLRRVLNGLRDNDVTHLYIFSDGAANREEQPAVEETRDVIRSINWCETTVEMADQNIGLAESITSGVESMFADGRDSIIVIEDDCVPTRDFLCYMTDALDRYEDDERVMNVNGYSPPIEIPASYPHDIYFTYRSSSWGWGTWRSAWEQFEQDPMTLTEAREREDELKQITKKAGRDIYPMLLAQLKGEIDSWAVWWSYTIAAANGVCVNPVDSKIQNIGHDGSGSHSGRTDRFDVITKTTEETRSYPETVLVDKIINSRYNRAIHGGRKQQFKQLLTYAIKSTGLWETYQKVRKLTPFTRI